MHGHDEDSAIRYATRDYWAGKGGEHLDKMRDAAQIAGASALVLSWRYDAMTDALRDVAREMDNLRSVRDDLLAAINAAEAGLEAAQADALRRARKGGE